MIQAIIDALNAANTSFTTIAHALSVEPAENLETDAPANYLYEGDGKGLDADGDSCVENTEVRSVVSLIVCKWVDLEALRNETKSVIRGFQFKSEQTPMKLTHSSTVKIKGEYVWRKDIYTTVDYA